MPFKENAKALQAKLGEEKAVWDGIDARIAAAEKQTYTDETEKPKAVEKAGEPTADEQAQLKALQTEIKELDDRCAQSKEWEDLRTQNEQTRKTLTEPGHRPDYGNPAGDREIKTLADRFLNAPEWKQYLNFIAKNGFIGTGGRIDGPAIEVPLSIKALVTGASLGETSGSGMVRADYRGVVPFFQRPLSMRDVVTIGRTTSDTVEFTQITAFDNRAAPVAEATTGALDSSSGIKPESGLNTAIVKEPVRTIAHWIPITRRALMDAAQMEGYINDLLMDGAEIKLEDQMITGDGTGENLLGLDNTPGITLQSPVLTSGSIDLLKTARQARTKVRTVGRARASAYVFHPDDWESFDVLTNNSQGTFYFGGPMQMGNPRLWGLPVIESEAIRKGTFYTGDLKQAVLWDREQANVRASDSPDNYFLRNLVALLCELRAAFGVLRPAAIVRGDLVVGSNS